MNQASTSSLVSDDMLLLQQSWLETSLGQYLLAKEQALYDQAVADLFGFNALQMGFMQMDLLKNSRIPNRFKASEFNHEPLPNHLCCNDDFLPFADMSLDLLILPHRLEFSERPHQTLREAERVMIPEGHLLISGFNPFSTWGIESVINRTFSRKPRFVKHFPKRFPWCGDFISLSRMKDWLKLMGFEIVHVDMSCHVPPFEQASWHKRFNFMDRFNARWCSMLGGIYFIVAKKRVPGMTPLKPDWKNSTLKNALVAKPTQSTPTQKELEKHSPKKK